MKTMHMWMSALAGVLLFSAAAAPAWADDGHDRGGFRFMVAQDHHRGDQHFERGDRERHDRVVRRDDNRGRRPGFVFDRRYHHDHYYPRRGYFARALPRNYLRLYYGGLPYYYWQGIWYNSSGLGFVVVPPPFGVVVPMLPPYYTTIWVGGVPYYYANDIYYAWRPAAQGYAVVQAPPDANVVTQPPPAGPNAPAPSSNPDQFYVYPEKGQSSELQAKDRYECHRWAVGQTGFDPSQPSAGLSGSDLTSKRADYRRAIEACLDARGYSVK